jgi:hypothetical protein
MSLEVKLRTLRRGMTIMLIYIYIYIRRLNDIIMHLIEGKERIEGI